MEDRIKYFLHVSFTILIVCYFGTVVSYTSSPSTVQTTAVPSSVPSTVVPSSVSMTVGPSSVPTTVGPSSVPSTVGPSSVPSTAGPSSVPTTVGPSSVLSSATTMKAFTSAANKSTSSMPSTMMSTLGSETCASLDYVYNVGNGAYYTWHVYNYNYAWHNMSFWGGHLQIPWKENLDDTCFYWIDSYFLTLSDKHKDIADIGEDILTSDACILNQNQTDNCILDVSVEMRKCNGHLLYRFPWNYSPTDDNDLNIYYNTYICFEREYTDTCESSEFVYTAGNMSGRFLNVSYGDTHFGWFDAHRDGKQYVLPSFEDVEDVFENCLPDYGYYYGSYFLKEGMPQDIGEDPVRLSLCNVYKNYYGNYDNYNEYEDDYYYDNNCHSYVYARKCQGKIQFDLPQYWGQFCFIHYNKVKVLPEIGHTEESRNDGTRIYSPFLQFRCSFEMAGTTAYRVNWYINGTLWMQTGPSSDANHLALKGEGLNELRLGYQSLKLGEKWDANMKYRFRLSTIDHDYDDKLYFDMSLLVTKASGHTLQDTEIISTVQVTVTDSRLHWNKRCYSHNDPHMRTGDGRYYGHQIVGNYMMYRNKAYQSEVHEYTRYCWEGYNSGPVCACGVAVRSGADVFMINRCGNFTILDFLQCGDGGILEVEPIHGYRYKVTTPIGTIVIINLHSWGKTLDIDIYLSAKDFGNIDGLCGYFDGNRNNDFRHRDGSESAISNGYYYHEFTESWRLLDAENFLKNANRSLEHWDENNGGTAGHPCFKPDSITKNKCLVQRRKRREAAFRFETESTRHGFMTNAESKRERRSTGQDITEEEARALCNSSIYEAPAVREFSDKLADEDPKVVLTQCVYDIVHGNDTVWAEAHVNALNNIVASVISLNPVFAANNSESVKSFLSQTCLNNCSGHGECSETGLCTCEGIFRGPDCGIDLRIPPVIYDIQDGGMCDTANDDECNCFVIRTDNIFEGFTYEISTYELLFDGTRKQIGQSVNVGEYEDIFTGVCCAPEQRKKRSFDDSSDPSIMMFDVVISNDGNNFGQSKSVYVFDSSCIHFEHSGGIMTIVLKDGYCFIGGACVEQKSTLQTPSGCYLCEPKSIPYAWTHVSCGGDNVGLATSTLIAAITGSVFAGIILTAVIVYVRCFKGSKKRRTVEDIPSSQAYLSPGPARETWGQK
ncbi:uncharacterized protein LOC123542645 isoform X2 [Mercenaria mercenaria]|uniref:uncharacterized protein LOC123542645 isoform X2 n=1 Tax=Mercenaria mercenaria TaxID=6596 RepID=UPI00234F1BCA|nr:uncharacterized protein LOC123542645 isoform X2 [Mercenaria mercenaria]